MGALQYGTRKNIENLATSMAAMARKTIFAKLVNFLAINQGVSFGAVQTMRVQKTQQKVVALLKTHQGLNGKFNHRFF
jgi:hypothetical protein